MMCRFSLFVGRAGALPSLCAAFVLISLLSSCTSVSSRFASTPSVAGESLQLDAGMTVYFGIYSGESTAARGQDFRKSFLGPHPGHSYVLDSFGGRRDFVAQEGNVYEIINGFYFLYWPEQVQVGAAWGEKGYQRVCLQEQMKDIAGVGQRLCYLVRTSWLEGEEERSYEEWVTPGFGAIEVAYPQESDLRLLCDSVSFPAVEPVRPLFDYPSLPGDQPEALVGHWFGELVLPDGRLQRWLSDIRSDGSMWIDFQHWQEGVLLSESREECRWSVIGDRYFVQTTHQVSDGLRSMINLPKGYSDEEYAIREQSVDHFSYESEKHELTFTVQRVADDFSL